MFWQFCVQFLGYIIELTANDLSKLSEIIRKGEGAESERSKYITRKIKEFTEDMTAYDAQIVMEIVDMF